MSHAASYFVEIWPLVGGTFDLRLKDTRSSPDKGGHYVTTVGKLFTLTVGQKAGLTN